MSQTGHPALWGTEAGGAQPPCRARQLSKALLKFLKNNNFKESLGDVKILDSGEGKNLHVKYFKDPCVLPVSLLEEIFQV